eukprot:15323962-Ditylum_brightwellii.AAC.1
MELITWDAFRIAGKHQSQHSQQIVKTFHGILPTNELLYRRDTGPHYIMRGYRIPEMEIWCTV